MSRTKKKALIVGISGQDGAYLARLLLQKGYEVHGTSRDHELSSLNNLVKLGIRDRIKMHSMAMGDFRSVLTTLKKSGPWGALQPGRPDLRGAFLQLSGGDV